jgi:hypothetical protein
MHTAINMHRHGDKQENASQLEFNVPRIHKGFHSKQAVSLYQYSRHMLKENSG